MKPMFGVIGTRVVPLATSARKIRPLAAMIAVFFTRPQRRRCPRLDAAKLLLAAGLSVVLAHGGNACAQEMAASTPTDAVVCGARDPGDTRVRIGLALGGGGARGIAHISVLRLIEELKIPVDCIAGTSMGSLVGGLYASGMSVDELEKLVTTADWKRLFDDSLERPQRSLRRKLDDRDALATVGVGFRGGGVKLTPGLLQGERILALFERSTQHVSSIRDFNLLPIPYRAVATDLNSGEAVVLDHGSLGLAMRASMSLPGIFQPVEIDGRVLLDGGLVNQVPVDVVRAMGADIVIAVDVGTPLAKLDRNASLLQVVSQISGMMTTGNTRRQSQTLAGRDVLIVPALGDSVATGDFTKAREALAIGAQAAEQARERLAPLSVGAGVYAAAIERRPKGVTGPPIIEFVRLENETDYADEVLMAYVSIPTGVPLDPLKTEEGLLRAYGLGTLSSITYEIVQEGGHSGVLLRARPKPQGPNYLQLGLTVSSNFDGSFESNVRAAILFSPLTPNGAEARVIATLGSEPGLKGEYYHPLDPASRNVLYASAFYENPNLNVYDPSGHKVARFDVQRTGMELRAIHEFGNYSAIGIGANRARGEARVEIGDPQLQSYEFQDGSMFVELNVDRLDSLFFPRNGYYAQLGYSIAREWLGSDGDYETVDIDTLAARSFGRHALQIGGRYHSTLSGVLPVQNRYRLGGRSRLAGFHTNELTGQHYALVFAGYTYELAKLFGRSALVGGTVEYGNAWEQRQDMRFGNGLLNASIYTGFDSWVGPMLFGYGWREDGDGVLFLEIGRPF
jgi:NTE family protein